MSEHHHVVRIDIEPSEDSPRRSSTHGWQVRVSHDGTRKTKFFADRKYGGREAALQLAIEHRDELLATRPEPSGPVERRAQRRSTSGVAGIRLAFKNGTAYIEANWVGEDGRAVTSFSVGRWGLRKATWRACKSRALGLGVRDPERIQSMFETAYSNLQTSLAVALADHRGQTGGSDEFSGMSGGDGAMAGMGAMPVGEGQEA